MTGLLTAPPIELKDTGPGDNEAAIYVVLHQHEWLMICPDGNRIGTFLLRELIEARLSIAGVEFVGCVAAFPLNSAQFVVLLKSVHSVQAGAEVILKTLDGLGLALCSQIAWACPEDGLHVIHNPSKREFKKRTADEMQADWDVMRQICRGIDRSDNSAEQ
jgi:hypothetical protein